MIMAVIFVFNHGDQMPGVEGRSASYPRCLAHTERLGVCTLVLLTADEFKYLKNSQTKPTYPCVLLYFPF